jgi:hypothetical protein
MLKAFGLDSRGRTQNVDFAFTAATRNIFTATMRRRTTALPPWACQPHHPGLLLQAHRHCASLHL